MRDPTRVSRVACSGSGGILLVMASDYTPTIVNTGPTDPTAEPARPALTLKCMSGSYAGTDKTFTQDLVAFGRSDGNDLKFDPQVDVKVSGFHGRLLHDKTNGWQIEDLRSTNGTFVNGKRIAQPTTLHSGDMIVLGDPADPAAMAMQVVIAGQPMREPPKPVAPPAPPPASGSPYVSSGLPASGVPSGASGESEDEGFFGRIKGKYRRWSERRELQKQLEQMQADLVAMQQRHLQVFQQLGREIVDANLVDRQDIGQLPATGAIRRARDTIAQHDGQIGDVRQSIQSDEQRLADWLTGWQETFNAADAVRTDAESKRDSAGIENAEADQSLRALLKPRVEQMRDAGSRLTQAAQQIESVPESTTPDQLHDLGQSLQSAGATLTEPLENLPSAIERLLTSRPALADAERALVDATKAVEAVRADRAKHEAEHKQTVAAKQQQIAQIEQQIAQQRGAIQQQHLPLGQQAIDAITKGALRLDTPAVASARGAITEQQQLQQRINETTARVASLQ